MNDTELEHALDAVILHSGIAPATVAEILRAMADHYDDMASQETENDKADGEEGSDA